MIAPALNKVPGIADDAALNQFTGNLHRAALNEAHELSRALTMSIDEVAATLGLTARSLMRKHRRMQHDHGFPPPLPGGVWMWSRAAFEAWVRANGVRSVELDAVEPLAVADNDGVVALVREQNASLRMRYGAER